MRRVTLLLEALGVAVLMAGCTVPISGLAGVGVDARGHLLGYLHVCHDRIDGATLYYDTAAGSAQEVDAGSWEATAPVTRTATWSMETPARGWRTRVPLRQLTTDRHYTLYGWTSDNSSSAGGVTFRLRETAQLQPGQVLYSSGRSGGRPERELNVIGTLPDFQKRACESVEP